MLAAIPRVANENVLVGFETSDDAGVYRLTPDSALVQTVDFFTPIVDDPFLFGAIAAANSLSDVYAMGGRPLTALSVLCYPAKGDLKVLEDILAGGAAKLQEAECAVIGGHSVTDDEIKFGYSVAGIVHPDRIWANRGARPGDVLVLTKPIGTGAISTALKKGLVADQHLQVSIECMLLLNRSAFETLTNFEIHACTDITGFGLIGHAREMAVASGCTIEIDALSVPLLPGALEYAQAGVLPGGQKNNLEFAADCVDSAGLDHALEALLYDPQTSGGLLAALPAADAAKVSFPVVGRVLERKAKLIQVR